MQLIGLTGKMGAGKDFTKAWLGDQGYYVAREAFADGLRYELEEVLNAGVHLPGLWSKPYSAEVRAIQQWYGTEFRRDQDPDYWLKKLNERLDGYEHMDDILVCVTDVRFPNEGEVIKARGGLVVQVWAPTVTRARRLGLDAKDLQEREQHVSEKAMDNYPFDVVLVSEDNTVRPQYGAQAWTSLLEKVQRNPWKS